MSYKVDVGFVVKPGIKVPDFGIGNELSLFWDYQCSDHRGTIYAASDCNWSKFCSDTYDAVLDFLKTLDKNDFLFIILDKNDGVAVTMDGYWFLNNFGFGYVSELRFVV